MKKTEMPVQKVSATAALGMEMWRGWGIVGTVLRLRWGGNSTSGETVMMVTGVEMEMEGDVVGRRVRSKWGS